MSVPRFWTIASATGSSSSSSSKMHLSQVSPKILQHSNEASSSSRVTEVMVVSPKILQHSIEASSSSRVTEVMVVSLKSSQPSYEANSSWRVPEVMALSFTSTDNEAYEAPAFEEVVTTGYISGPTIWTITSSPGTMPVEPPPYSVVIEPPAHGETVVEAFSVSVAPGPRRASEADLQSRFRLRLLRPPKLQRFVSDTHELKGVEERAERPEPLTPPPAYENATVEEIFEEEFEPSRL
ncbi:uncharacterized protein LOC132591266 [Zootoca vivipara]|uniref:uncharacterized protein LOC132591266 n=1 Tax=Zootoca vivipara TaxID=8524 RepID=UPI00293C0B13|nr:uncharacterized protein LOC132591266 [Zootoca vivipara]